MPLPFTIHLTQTFPIAAVTTVWSDSPFLPPPNVNILIDEAWKAAQIEAAQHGRDLFPGAMTRLNRWHAHGSELTLYLGPTDYRVFVGTNLRHPELAEQYGVEALANPLGLSIAIVTADDQIVVQKRSDHVFELPGHFHVGGGNVEPVDVASADAPGIIASITREVEEELAIAPHQIGSVICLSLAENANVRKPDLLIAATVNLPAEVVATRTNAEYSALICLPDEPALSAFLIDQAIATSPAGIACLLALGKHRYGTEWHTTHLRHLTDLFV